MRKINLEALESKNMTAAAEDTLSEINGGCTFRIARCNNCGRSMNDYYVLDVPYCCGNGCKGNAALYYAYRTGFTGKMELIPHSDTSWGVRHEDTGNYRDVSCRDNYWHFY